MSKISCKDCGGDVGTTHIHKNLHLLFSINPELKTRYRPNSIILEYWRYFNGFGDISIYPDEMENIQSIDREIRNILPASARGKAKEVQVRYRYGYAKGTGNYLGLRN